MILQQIRERAGSDIQHIVLPEGEDPRTVRAADICSRDKIARISVLGNEEKVRAAAAKAGANLNGVTIVDHRKSADFGRMATLYYELRRAKGDLRPANCDVRTTTCELRRANCDLRTATLRRF